MAQQAEPVRRLEEQITCPICLDRYNDPKLLPCGHSFCLTCLQGIPLYLRNDQHFFKCPECREPCLRADNGLGSLPPSFTVNNLIEVYDQLQQLHISDPTAQTGVTRKCDNCDESDANRYCQQCSRFFCMKCLEIHDKWKPNYNHQLVSIDIATDVQPGQTRRPNGSSPIAIHHPPVVPITTPDTHQQQEASHRQSMNTTSQQSQVVADTIVSADDEVGSDADGFVLLSRSDIPCLVAVQQDIPLGNPFPNLNKPSGVAVTDNGLVIVSEYGSHCITILNRNGEKIRSFGCNGKKKGELVDPQGIAITSTGTILVADSGNHRIQEFTIEGTCVSCVGGKGDGPLYFNRPHGIAIHKETGYVFIADNHNHRVQVLRPDLTFNHMFGGLGFSSKNGQMSCPHDVAIDSNGFVYVTNYNHDRVSKYRVDGQFVASLGTWGIGQGTLSCPSGITIDDRDRLYVNNCLNDHVVILDTEGQCIGSIAKELLWQSPIFFYPPVSGVALDKSTGRVLACLTSKKTIKVFDKR